MKTRKGVELASRNACLFGLVSFFPLGFPPQKAQESVLEYVSAICAAQAKVIVYKSSNVLFLSNRFGMTLGQPAVLKTSAILNFQVLSLPWLSCFKRRNVLKQRLLCLLRWKSLRIK